jgi:hypothetical protein
MIASKDLFGDENLAIDGARVLSNVAHSLSFDVAARKWDILQLDATLSAILPASVFLTCMLAWFMKTLTRLWT